MAHVERLGGEGVGLHLHVRSGDLVDEAGLAHVREAWEGGVRQGRENGERNSGLLNDKFRDRIMYGSHTENRAQVYIRA